MISPALMRPWWCALAGRRAWIAVPIGALIAAVLALDPVLGPEDGLGTYLAYCSLFPIALMFRLGAVIDARRRDGLELEETLRNPRGNAAPGAALAAAWLALAAGSAICALPPLLLAFATEAEPLPALHPLRVSPEGEDAWTFDANGPIASGSELLLSFTFESAPSSAAAVQREDGLAFPLEPGVLVRVPISREDAGRGRLRLMMNDSARAAGAALIRPLVRLVVPRPALSAAPWLFWRQFLFAAPLLCLVILLARRGKVGGALAALTAVALAGLLAFDSFEPPSLGNGPADLLARAVLSVRDLFPDLRGLAAVGRGFELRAGTLSGGTAALWLLLGILVLMAPSLLRRKN